MNVVQAKVDCVKNSIISASTCTPATVTILNELLPQHLSKNDERHDASTKSNGKPLSTIQNVSRGPRTIQKGVRGAVKNNASGQVVQLSARQKATLATEVVNSTIRILDSAIKSSRTTKRQLVSRDVVKNAIRQPLRRTSSAPQELLQRRSLERVSSSPSIHGRSSRSSSTNSSPNQSYKAVAECARLAFACLRGLQESKQACTDLPNLRLEAGMSSLITKLTQLGMEDLAAKELIILKRRLEGKGSHQLPGMLSNRPGEATTRVGKGESLADLLVITTSSGADLDLLNMITTCQIHALKLIAISRKPSLLERILPVLDISRTNSIVQILLRIADRFPEQSQKAARHMETVSTLILSLCPSLSTSRDETSTLSEVYISAQTALRLQALAYGVKSISWKLSGYRAEAWRELAEPFIRCMTTFSRRSKLPALDTYLCTMEALDSLKAQCQKNNLDYGNSFSATAAAKLFSNLAERAQKFDVAIHWLELIKDSFNDTTNLDTSQYALMTRLIALKLQTFVEDTALVSSFSAVLAALRGPLKGSAHDLEQLFTEVAHARKAAIGYLAHEKSLPEEEVGRVHEELRGHCRAMIFQCPRFMLRFLGQAPNPGADAKLSIAFEQRRRLTAKFLPATIDSVLFLIKRLNNARQLAWETADAALRSCLDVARNTQDLLLSAKSDKQSVSHLVRISHAYYNEYLESQKSAHATKDADSIKLLMSSIDCVKDESAVGKKAAFWASKMDRLVGLYSACGESTKALETQHAINAEIISTGLLCDIAAAAQTEALTCAWGRSEVATRLSIGMTTIIKLYQKVSKPGTEMLMMGNAELALDERGIYLEKLLSIVRTVSRPDVTLLTGIMTRLLDIYHPQEYPIRRLRILANNLSCIFDGSSSWKDECKQALACSMMDSLVLDSKDGHLTRYAPHLRTLLLTTLELQEDHPRLDLIQPHLALWYSLVDEHRQADDLEKVVDDVSELVSQLTLVSRYLDFYRHGEMRIGVLHLITRIRERCAAPTDLGRTFSTYTALARQYLQLGYSGKAGLILDKIQNQTNLDTVSPYTMFDSLLAHARYLLIIGNIHKCEEMLRQAHGFATKNGLFEDNHDRTEITVPMVEKYLVLAEASLCNSQLSHENSRLSCALLHARRAVRLLYQAWNGVERTTHSRVVESHSDLHGASDQGEGLSHSSLLTEDESTINEKLGARFWPLINPLFGALSHLSQLYQFQGMFQESLFYAEQAELLIRNTQSQIGIGCASGVIGSVWLKAGVTDKAQCHLLKSKDSTESIHACQDIAVIRGQLADLYQHQGQHCLQLKMCQEASAVLADLSRAERIDALEKISDPATMLETALKRLSLTKQNPKRLRKTGIRDEAPTSVIKEQSLRKVKVKEQPIVLGHECLGLELLTGRIARKQARMLMDTGDFAGAMELLKQALPFSKSNFEIASVESSMSQCLSLKGIKGVATNSAFTMLRESTISFPSIAQSSRVASVIDKSLSIRVSPGRRNVTQFRSNRSLCSTESLLDAHTYMMEHAPHMFTSLSASSLHELSSLMQTGLLMLSATGQVKSTSTAAAHFAAYAGEMAKLRALKFEKQSLARDNDFADMLWPKLETPEVEPPLEALDQNISHFQRDFVDIIPSSWTVISIALSGPNQDLCLTKLEARQGPFVLRLPLGRNNSRDLDEEVFGFEQGRAELRDILNKANLSSHSARGLTGKLAKTAWWAERDALDLRMKDLLDNIQNIWIGGFRGIFSQRAQCPELLARFQKSFQNILDKHLPSRQKAGKMSKISRVTLDSRTMELFTGLGDPTTKEDDFDEPLTDLLYFVIDILQFHGERNAYDEIDFDAIIVETQSALQSYHQALLSMSTSTESRHTILILDKTLHAFPWESLPCMDGMAVSRMPSLSCLRDRLVMEKQDAEAGVTSGPSIDRSSVAFILNPSGDLANTQETFERPLQNVETWTGMTNRVPTETEFRSHLEDKDLVLYFGHGSGAQYIRPKVVKRLQRCAVTILMGCSSGTLTEVGDFEPYGTPMNYMLAGCPALVATLWDVTDKDIDRFAERMFQEWGLFRDDDTLGSRKGRGEKKERVSELDDKISLVQAVARGRKACHLKYLTAAAVCVYGIPVYFK